MSKLLVNDVCVCLCVCMLMAMSVLCCVLTTECDCFAKPSSPGVAYLSFRIWYEQHMSVHLFCVHLKITEYWCIEA